MPKTTDADDKAGKDYERIELRLKLPLASRFHTRRGDVPAATYIRRLIERDLAGKHSGRK